MRRRPLPLLALIMLPCAGLSADYRFTPQIATSDAKVTVKISGNSNEFRMPAWAPGDYQLFNYGKFVADPEFRRRGEVVPFTRTDDPNLWRIEGGADEVTYTAKSSRGNFTMNLRVKPDEVFISGPGVFGWFAGHDREKQTLTLDVIPGSIVAVALPELKSASDAPRFEAKDYDELLDSPIAFGSKLKVTEFTVKGKPHRFVGLNSSFSADLNSFAIIGAKAAESCHALFGELPYPQYIFFADFLGGGGSLEHANSTRLGVYSASPSDIQGTAFHEFFHAYNVKRIRAKPLGPFDYTKPAVTGTLWWLEGVTDYYSEVLLFRSGLINRAQFLASVSDTWASLKRTPATFKVSADEASRRVWETRGSFGFGGLSYYTKGRGIGALLDIAIRTESKGKYSLDDVMRSLYAECLKGPGYEEGRIRELCVRFGGAKLGPLYDTCVTQAVDLPVEQALIGSGLRLGANGLEDDPDGPKSLFPSAIGKQ
ncbi:MAG: hypothetical protein ACOYON_10210 [Fimbriimonas sp.]